MMKRAQQVMEKIVVWARSGPSCLHFCIRRIETWKGHVSTNIWSSLCVPVTLYHSGSRRPMRWRGWSPWLNNISVLPRHQRLRRDYFPEQASWTLPVEQQWAKMFLKPLYWSMPTRVFLRAACNFLLVFLRSSHVIGSIASHWGSINIENGRWFFDLQMKW